MLLAYNITCTGLVPGGGCFNNLSGTLSQSRTLPEPSVFTVEGGNLLKGLGYGTANYRIDVAGGCRF